MSDAPVYDIDPKRFWTDPYPDLARMRAEAPICYVPQLGATLITRRDDIFANEKVVEVFSSDQPEGLMTVLMGQNMMRKDGDAHMHERRVIFPTVSPKTVKTVWKAQFEDATARALDRLAGRDRADLVKEFAMEVSAEALKSITGLTNMDWREMDRVSQGMIDGCANYAGDPAVTANCNDCTASIDRHISARMDALQADPDLSLIAVQMQAGIDEAQMRANVKLAISGGQNEPRDAIAGAAWALLSHPEWLQAVRAGDITWLQVFEEYARWISPIGMSPRRIAKAHDLNGIRLDPGDRLFFMFGSGNRDETVFARPDIFDPTQDIAAAISFGAGPHFCAGAWASRCLIAEVALPMLFGRFPGIALAGEAPFGGWAFRGPLSVPVRLR
ncbi:cytochrome P450 [Thalassovita aquimarina]|uniref:Cytochrome P450 n=2 Tax=Thalassovita aquimarina TaxID=2785917 RepID=A0ABS5HVU0_9RHOB|nr:cytochrome P450 [Thalassovita aquimarina]MBR9653056.1 cytochrome P450 [Thalassovita aquimarina]